LGSIILACSFRGGLQIFSRFDHVFFGHKLLDKNRFLQAEREPKYSKKMSPKLQCLFEENPAQKPL
jgi:hypothetical protein